MAPNMSFGRFFKEMRLRLGLGLREFCLAHGLDAGNISKLERGVVPPPRSREKIEEYAAFLRLSEGTDEWYEFFDLAAAETGRIPDDILSDAQLVEKLPVVFRTLRGKKLPEGNLDDLLERIRRA
jgi:transcriptional regulator with XRE-family HTH domain